MHHIEHIFNGLPWRMLDSIGVQRATLEKWMDSTLVISLRQEGCARLGIAGVQEREHIMFNSLLNLRVNNVTIRRHRAVPRG